MPEFLEELHHLAALGRRGQVTGVDGVKTNLLGLPMVGNGRHLSRQIQAGKILEQSVGGQHRRGNHGTFHPHGGDDWQSHGEGTAAQAGDVLQGDNSFHMRYLLFPTGYSKLWNLTIARLEMKIRARTVQDGKPKNS